MEFYLGVNMKRKIFFLLLIFVVATFAKSVDSVKVVTPRDSVFALLDTTETCTSKFGADTTKWNGCVNLAEDRIYYTFKRGKASGPAWEPVGCERLCISKNGTFLYFKKGEIQYYVTYTPNGYIEKIVYDDREIYYGGRTNPFSGKDSVFEEGRLVSSTTYKNGLEDGFDYAYYPNKQKKYERYYINGLREGLQIYYRENGQIESETNYKKGKLVGNVKEYYENDSVGERGAIRRITPYANGKVDGLVKEYYRNGQIWRTVSYKKGKREGKQIEYSAKTGKVISTAVFRNDELIGDKKCVDGRFGSEELDCTSLNE